MITIIAFSVFFIAFCVLAYLSAKNWLLRHVFLVVGVFIMSIVFVFLAAMTLETHKVWRSRYTQYANDLRRTEARIAELSDPVGKSDDALSVPQLQADLSRVILDRGRVWRGVQVIGANGLTVDLDMSNWGNEGCTRGDAEEGFDDPGEGQAAPAQQPFKISEKMLLHAFAVRPVTPDDAATLKPLDAEIELTEETRGPCTLPTAYAGHFVVKSVNENSVKLEAVDPLDDDQLAMLEEAGLWTLYEVLPVDDHKTLTGFTEEALDSLFRAVRSDVPADQLAKSVHDFHRDGAVAEPGDDEDRAIVKVRFKEAYEIPVDIDGEPDADGRSFDVRGRAVPTYLRQGQPTQFAVGEEAEFDAVTANQLVQDGKCELVDEPTRYLRPLRNYDLIFSQGYASLDNAKLRIDEAASELAALHAATEQIRQQISYRSEEKKKLEEDQQNYRNDADVASQFREMLAEMRDNQLNELRELFEMNNALRAQMAGF